MLESITVNYDARDFFRSYEMRSDTKHGPSGADVHRALEAVKRGGYYVHFNYGGGRSDCVYMDGVDEEQGTWTLIHWESANGKDDPVRIDPREARKRIRAAIKEE